MFDQALAPDFHPPDLLGELLPGEAMLPLGIHSNRRLWYTRYLFELGWLQATSDVDL